MKDLEEKFKNLHLLSRDERKSVIREAELLKPEFLKVYYPGWWWWRRCVVKVLIVTDGGLDFGTGAGGLSEFLTSFNQLQATTWNNYRLTLGHRNNNNTSAPPNPLIEPNNTPGASSIYAPIKNFNFQTSVTLSDFDQVWLFGINPGSGLPPAELTVVENYMNSGGGLFATGDHGDLGSALCGNITRVKDMRIWSNTTEVSMTGNRRNDTNRPRPGDITSRYFDNQSDSVPQNILAATFGGGLPHPLLSISTALRPSGVIDIMPDHPHEGECRPVTTFTVNGVAVPTQIVATSYVLANSTTQGGAGKALTDPHSFPSISVWDGRLANAGRIVIDSTWHHFVNINLNGVGSSGSFFSNNDLPGLQSGLTNPDWIVVRQYFMNISLWMSRKKSWWCWRRILWVELLKQSQLVEASLNNPVEKIENITLADLGSIGSLAEEVLSSKFNPSFAREFLVEMLDDLHPKLAHSLNIFKPEIKGQNQKQNDYYQPWINQELIFYTAVGAGFIALRDDKNIASNDMTEKDLDRIEGVFKKGMEFGMRKSLVSLDNEFKRFSDLTKLK